MEVKIGRFGQKESFLFTLKGANITLDFNTWIFIEQSQWFNTAKFVSLI